ncbi:hypothetical protein GCM10008023_05840 [Sphingomonas glacialis]|uniref:Uncharacterized protein n=1 Tax=Sphingomonas glacialis TaxID=658225 RepID=A0ABQ3LA35_9SPHN|nr:hypothetical protein [Sphingomonas glacialis]GHH09315.1 hypothetical protein GCM10008023_05840 [Sphingomonas glacialis]
MADTMIERIARVLCAWNGEDPDEIVSATSGFQRQTFAETPPGVAAWTRHTGRARTLLSVMREPTEQMLAAERLDVAMPELVWRKMIGSALGESA